MVEKRRHAGLRLVSGTTIKTHRTQGAGLLGASRQGLPAQTGQLKQRVHLMESRGILHGAKGVSKHKGASFGVFSWQRKAITFKIITFLY